MTHNKAFQIKRHSNLDDNPSGHWQQFCQKLGAKADRECTLMWWGTLGIAFAATKKSTAGVLRNQGTGNHYLYEHEESVTHKRLHDQTGEVELVQQPCEGVLLGQGQVPQLDKFSESILKWVAAGQLNFASSPKTDPLNLVAVVWRENDLLLKHCQCLGMRGTKAPACETCLHLAQSRALHTQICKWAWRIDMASYGRALALDPQEARAAVREALMNADYTDIQESGKDEAGV